MYTCRMDWIGQIALATLVTGLFAWLRADLTSMRKELRADIQKQGTELRADLSLLGKEVAKLRERMAHMEGLLEGLREAVAGKRVA